MKANKCAVVSRRMRAISQGSYTPFKHQESSLPRRNPYDKPNSSLPQYNGRISW